MPKAKKPAPKDNKQNISEAEAWRMMGEAFTWLMQSMDAEHSGQRKAAIDLAQWLYLNCLTNQQQYDFMTATGWRLDPDDLRPLPVAKSSEPTIK